jgi:transposase
MVWQTLSHFKAALEGAELDAKDQLKIDIISLLDTNKISIDEARLALSVSQRTVERYLEIYQTKGVAFVLHGNKGRAPINKTNATIASKATTLIKEKYFDFNLTHALEKLSSEEGIVINREAFRKACHEIGMVKRARKRRSKVRKARDRISQAGVMLQMDGSPHRWFGGTDSCLIGAIDDATSEVCGAEFFESETTLGCMKVLKSIIERKGLFNILYTDRAGIFGGQKRVQFSQVKRALGELGIRIIFANSAQAKGRIERLWNTLQDRLVPEMRLKNIRATETANHFLQEEYLPNDHNKQFSVLPKNLEPAWRPVPSSIDLSQVFCIKDRRTVKNDHTFSWNGMLYKITSDFKYSIMNQKVEIRTYLDGTWAVYFADRKLEVLQHHIQPALSVEQVVEYVPTAEGAFKVRKDGHIEYQGGFYSVAEEYIGTHVQVSERSDVVLIYHQTTLIETHGKIAKGFRNSSTKPEHRGPWEKQLLPGSMYRRAASQVGPSCEQLIVILLQRGQGVIDNKNIWAIINLRKAYGRNAVEEVCGLAIKTSACDYRSVSTLLRLRYKKTGTI